MPQPNLETELNDAQRDEVDGWILSGVNYTTIIERLSERSWPSRSLAAWTGYKRRAESRAVQKSIFNGNQFRSQINELKKGTGDELLQSQLHLLGQIALQLSVNGTADPAQLAMAHKLTQLTLEAEGMRSRAALEEKKLVEKREDRALDERRVSLLEKKAAAYDRAEAALSEAKNSGGITPETLTKIERELKLL